MLTIPRICPRCGGAMGCHSVSFFNTQDICCDCKQDERQFPGFAAARAAEEAAVHRGDLNYPGVGLGPDDLAKMHEVIAARTKS